MNSKRWPKKTIIELLPEDFENSDFLDVADCPVARATKRKLNCEEMLVDTRYIDIKEDDIDIRYRITSGFTHTEYKTIKAYYEKHGAEKYIYYLKLTLV